MENGNTTTAQSRESLTQNISNLFFQCRGSNPSGEHYYFFFFLKIFFFLFFFHLLLPQLIMLQLLFNSLFRIYI